jgi:hypothetical protein
VWGKGWVYNVEMREREKNNKSQIQFKRLKGGKERGKGRGRSTGAGAGREGAEQGCFNNQTKSRPTDHLSYEMHVPANGSLALSTLATFSCTMYGITMHL